MDEHNDKALHERMTQLEHIVMGMQKDIKQLHNLITTMPAKSKLLESALTQEKAHSLDALKVSSAPLRTQPAPSILSPESVKLSFRPLSGWKVEDWLNKIGIGLLLLSVVFLYKYSIEQGWITPVVRISLGIVIGMTLLCLGLYIHSNRRNFSHVLLGGGIATFYITAYSAFQLYGLVNYPTSFASMVAVTLAAFLLALNKNAIVLSIIGTIGGLATPFLLYTGEGTIPGLVGYVCLILTLPVFLYFYRGWRSVHMIAVLLGWAVFILAHDKALSDASSPIFDKAALQFGIGFAWLVFWAIPALREALHVRNPEKWTFPELNNMERYFSKGTVWFARNNIHILIVTMPLVAINLSYSIWNISGKTEGLITIGISLVYGLVSHMLKKEKINALGYTHGLTALLILTIGFTQLFSGNTLLLILAAEAAVFHYSAKKLGDRIIESAAHFLYFIVGFRVFLGTVLLQMHGAAIFNVTGITYLMVIASIFGISYFLRKDRATKIYRISAHILFLAWIAREFSGLVDGQGYITISWGVYAVILILLAYRMKNIPLRIAAIATLMLIVGKLFIVDLAQLEVIWRILLFFGFGGLLLVLSYFLPGLWKSTN